MADEDIATMNGVDGCFGTCIGSLFDSIIVTSRKGVFELDTRTKNWIFVRSIDLAYAIFMRSGESFKAIHVDEHLYNEFIKHEKFSSISEECPN